MKLLKIFSTLLIATAMVFFLAGCDDDEDMVNPSEQSETAEPDNGGDKVEEPDTDEPDNDGSDNDEPDNDDGVGDDGNDGGDNGDETVWFYEDFDWLEGNTTSLNLGDFVGNDDVSANDVRLDQATLDDGTNLYTVLKDMGYSFESNSNGTIVIDGSNPYTFIAAYYLYFGNTTRQAGLYLPLFNKEIPSTRPVILSFDWCPAFTSGNKTPDPVTLTVEFSNDDEILTFDIPTHDLVQGDSYRWFHAEVDFTEKGVTIDGETQILIRPCNSQWGDKSEYHRWMLDNIKIYSPTEP